MPVQLMASQTLGGYVAGETATKFGGTYTMDALTLGLVMEQTEDVLGQDFMMLTRDLWLD